MKSIQRNRLSVAAVPIVWSCATQGAARGTNNQLIGLRFHDRLRLFVYNMWQTPEGFENAKCD